MIQTQNLGYSVKNKTLLEGISLTFPSNEISMVIGPNGAGKSTLIKLLCGQLSQTSGDIWLNNINHREIPKKQLARKLAVLSQNIDLAFPLTAKEVVLMGRYPHFQGRPGPDDKAIVDKAIRLFKIEALAERNFLTLSGGEKQRVQFARVAAQIWPDSNNETKFLLLDEPLTFLDVYYQHEFMDMLKSLMGMQPMTVVGVVHDLNLAYRYADQITLIHQGQLLASGKADEVFKKNLIYEAFKVEPHLLTDAEGRKFISF